MAEASKKKPAAPTKTIIQGEGVTASERYLKALCDRNFLSLWSYPSVFRDQGKIGANGDGKEVCDLLVVFEEHIIIFSDKHCRFSNTGDLKRDWGRWYKKTVFKSAQQVWGAERWIIEHPDRLFLDRQCRKPFPIQLPDLSKAKIHRIVIAHDASRVCRERLGGSGSLMLDSSLTGDNHLQRPFTIGRIERQKGYVHVFDDISLNAVMSTLDTVTDFVAYLAKKERLMTGETVVTAAGEEELMAAYLGQLNSKNEHDFVFKGSFDVVALPEGHWENFVRSPERRAQIAADRVSYSWDKLTAKFLHHAMSGTQHFNSGHSLSEQEQAFRILAREPRTRRRFLAQSIREVLERSGDRKSPWEARVIAPSNSGDPHYVFLVVEQSESVGDGKYREFRSALLSNYCSAVKVRYPHANVIVGIATEDINVREDSRSEDFVYLDTSNWTVKQREAAKKMQKELRLLKEVTVESAREHEYPVDQNGVPRSITLSRNSPCRCGSGQRFKRCCGKEAFARTIKRRRA